MTINQLLEQKLTEAIRTLYRKSWPKLQIQPTRKEFTYDFT